MNQTPSPKALSDICKNIYKGKLKRFSRNKLKTIMRPLYAPFHEIYPWINSGSTVLDIGCGSGAFLLLANHVRELGGAIGYDINKKSVSLANMANTAETVTFEAKKMPTPEAIKNAQVVTLIDVLHHITPDDKSELFKQLFSHISTGTRLIVKDLDPKPSWRALANRITDALSTQSIVHYISLDDLVHLLKQKGFVIREKKRLFRHVWSHYLLVADFVGFQEK